MPHRNDRALLEARAAVTYEDPAFLRRLAARDGVRIEPTAAQAQLEVAATFGGSDAGNRTPAEVVTRSRNNERSGPRCEVDDRDVWSLSWLASVPVELASHLGDRVITSASRRRTPVSAKDYADWAVVQASQMPDGSIQEDTVAEAQVHATAALALANAAPAWTGRQQVEAAETGRG